MKRKRVLSMLVFIGAWLVFNVEPTWTQTSPAPGKGETKVKEGKGAQEPGQKERKKGEEEMEARGAQKPGRMEKNGSGEMGAKESRGEKWATQDVKRVQEALKSKGHDPGSMDGIIGPQTVQAIKSFQSANGLKATGRLDSETAEKLGIEKGAASGPRTPAKEAAPTQKESSSPKGK